MALARLVREVILKVRHDQIDTLAMLEHLLIELEKAELETVYLRSTQSELAGDLIEHSRELIQAKSRRLAVLELKAAYSGAETDPSIILEIDDLKGELETLWHQLDER